MARKKKKDQKRQRKLDKKIIKPEENQDQAQNEGENPDQAQNEGENPDQAQNEGENL